jgi:hypothetical protein
MPDLESQPMTFAPIAELVERITKAPELSQAIAATQQALAEGGVATADLHGIYVPAVAPAASVIAVPEETLLLARDARQYAKGGRLTLGQLGDMMREFGWPFPSGNTPGKQLLAFIHEQTRKAYQTPEDPRSFTWLFLAESAQRKIPAVNLLSARSEKVVRKAWCR